ncbi:HAD family phosphatase [uncultured Methylophaga sp.]|uniref:HAD family hydrolase n=1 Tax=uncultured Methylophaga sp. TaxID=285271 RepID=UPI00261AD1F1|nr:HAD family phosphatase [uncultured Methylophaga sp.]
MIKAVIFDMDGVIVDSEQIWDDAEKHVFSNYGIDITEADQLNTRNMNMRQVSEYWSLKAQSPFSLEVSEQSVIQRVCQQIQQTPVAMQGALNLLKQIHTMNFPIGLATNAPRAVCHTVLQCLQIETFFSSIQTADDVENTKPHPEIYLKSAHNLNVDPQHCLVFEDSPTGVKAAHAAGMRVIYVNPRRIAETSILSNIHSALSSLEQFSWSKF